MDILEKETKESDEQSEEDEEEEESRLKTNSWKTYVVQWYILGR